MKGQSRLTPLGIIAIILLVIGLLLLILGSGTVIKVIGVVIACVALLGFLGGQPASQRMAGFARPAMKDNISEMGVGHIDEPAPDYIEAAPEAPDSVWDHEKQLYREKAEHEHPGGEQPS
jgi:hypothetical protein